MLKFMVTVYFQMLPQPSPMGPMSTPSPKLPLYQSPSPAPVQGTLKRCQKLNIKVYLAQYKVVDVIIVWRLHLLNQTTVASLITLDSTLYYRVSQKNGIRINKSVYYSTFNLFCFDMYYTKNMKFQRHKNVKLIKLF